LYFRILVQVKEFTTALILSKNCVLEADFRQNSTALLHAL